MGAPPQSPLEQMIASGDTAAFVDFAAMLPANAKKKLWRGVFRGKYDESVPESTQIKKVLQVFVKLFLTTIYKKTGQEVPLIVKQALPDALDYPSQFMAVFLRQ